MSEARMSEAREPGPMAGWLHRYPLRFKLVVAVLVLVTVALTLISVASAIALRSYLVAQIDAQLEETVQRAEVQGPPFLAAGYVPGLPNDALLEWRLPNAQFTHYDRQQYDEEDLPPLPDDLGEATLRAGEPYSVQARDGEGRWRVRVAMLPDGTAFTVAQDMARADDAVQRLVATEIAVGTAVLALLAALGVVAVRTSLRPLAEIERTAGAIAGGDLSRRVPEPPDGNRTELGRLARALNAMLGHIEQAFAARAASEERMRQFVADASHELRTPLTTIRGFAELYRQGAATTPEETSRLLRRIEDEASRMGLLVEDLLLLARLDQERPLAQRPVVLPVVVCEAADAARAAAPDRTITVDTAGAADDLEVTGDEARLRQVVSNLLSNAVTHTPAQTPVVVRLRSDGDHAVLDVTDHGPGLSEQQRQRVFERFYRVDTARSRAGGGTGLGLAIVAALVAAHRGTVEVDSVEGQGTTFRVWLPTARLPAGQFPTEQFPADQSREDPPGADPNSGNSQHGSRHSEG